MTSGRKDILNDNELKDIIKSLTSSLVIIENKMISAWLDGALKFSAISYKEYDDEMHTLVRRLRNISSTLYNETDIKKVKNYKDNNSPENFNQYCNVSSNISHLVTQDVLYQQTTEQAIITMDRWIFICKIAFHQHDFFTASNIVYGLSSNYVSQSGIEKKLSATSVALFEYYRNLYDKPGSIYTRLKSLTRSKLDVIPVLYTLTHAHERVDSQPQDEKSSTIQQIEVAVKKRAISKEFIFLQKKISFDLSKKENHLLRQLKKSPDNEIGFDFEARSNILKSNMVMYAKAPRGAYRPLSSTNFCDKTDVRVTLITLINQISELESKYPSPLDKLLYNVRTTLRDAKYTDAELCHKMMDLFSLDPNIKLDRPLKKLYDNIQKMLENLVKDEKLHGKFIKDEDLKTELDSSEKSFEAIVRNISAKSLSRHAGITASPLITAVNYSSEDEETQTVSSSSTQLLKSMPVSLLSPRSEPDSANRVNKLRQQFGEMKNQESKRRASISGGSRSPSPQLFRQERADSAPLSSRDEELLKERSAASSGVMGVQGTKQ